MPYEIAWEDKPHIMFVRMTGVMTEEEIIAGINEVIRLAQEFPNDRVHSLLDCTALEQLPPLPITAREVRRVVRESPNRGTSTLYGLNRVMRFVIDMLVKVAGLRIRVFDTAEEARVFVRQMVETEQIMKHEGGAG